jgi:outer membrane receptor protein involved in Fe transport
LARHQVLRQIHAAYSSTGRLEIITVISNIVWPVIAQTAGPLRTFAAKRQLPWTEGIVSESHSRQFYQGYYQSDAVSRFGLERYPSCVLIGPDGMVLAAVQLCLVKLHPLIDEMAQGACAETDKSMSVRTRAMVVKQRPPLIVYPIILGLLFVSSVDRLAAETANTDVNQAGSPEDKLKDIDRRIKALEEDKNRLQQEKSQAQGRTAQPALPANADRTGLLDMSLEDLMNVKITGVSKKAETLRNVPMSAYIVTREELQRWNVSSTSEMLQRVPGYSFYNTDYYGQYGAIGRGLQSVWRYGFGFELMNVVDFGHYEFTPHFFKSVEVARGPAGLTWGSGAEAGLLNFNIRDDLNGLETVAEAGNYNRQSYDVMYGKKLDDQGRNFFVGWHLEQQGYQLQHNALDIPGQDWKENGLNPSQSLLAKVDYKPFKFIVFQDHADHIAPKLWFGPSDLQQALEQRIGTDAHDELEVLAYRLEYHLPIENDNLSLYLYHDSYKKQWTAEQIALDTQRKRSVGFGGTTKLLQDKLDLNFGGDLWGEDQVNAPSYTSTWAHDNYGINWYDTTLPSATHWMNSYIQGIYHLQKRLSILLGGRVDYMREAAPRQLYTGPQAGVFYDVTDTLTLKYLYNDARRRPQANEMTSDVEAESLAAHEIVAVYEKAPWQFDVTLFTQRLANQITRQNVPTLNAFINTGGLKSEGVEWGIKYTPWLNGLIYWNGSCQRCQVIQGTAGDGTDLTAPHDSQGRPLFVPEITNFIGTEVMLWNTVYANVDLRAINHIPYLTASGQQSEKDTVAFVDLTFRTKKFFHNRVSFSGACMNVFDTRTRVPAYGEHSGNANGTLEPDGRRFFLQLTAYF